MPMVCPLLMRTVANEHINSDPYLLLVTVMEYWIPKYSDCPSSVMRHELVLILMCSQFGIWFYVVGNEH